MKRTVQKAWLVLIGAMLLYWLIPGISFANVCSQGTGVPPFLSSGAKPNLLMVLDNSGSMLDAAYSEDDAYCFDDSYVSNSNYAGYFENDKWYKWTEGAYDPWQAGKQYIAKARVYTNGIIWETENGGKSTATAKTRSEDKGVVWKRISLKGLKGQWGTNAEYKVDDFVFSGTQLYRADKDNTGIKPDEDTAGNWTAVDSSWQLGKTYGAGDIVSFRGILYEASTGGTAQVAAGSSSYEKTLYNDTGVTWKRLDEGSFVPADNKATACAAPDTADIKYEQTEQLCMRLDTDVTPNDVVVFAAKGNLLNWAMSSKFDIEKEILTGGKYNYNDDFLINEHRGCSGSRTTKQIQVFKKSSL
ncbi:MAG: hypothetical protein D3916_04855 [Candidatus Electrothrix sp. MAN1_4]|nr:hypothetical protein [Candidatus Electrothrix sp. MAN1_4]